MLGSVVLDVAIGMAFVYLLLSLIATVVQEILAAFLQLRSANLQRGLCSLFSGDSLWMGDLVDAIYNHGLVRGLYMDPGRDIMQSLLDAAAGAKVNAADAAQAVDVAQGISAVAPGDAGASAALAAAKQKAADMQAALKAANDALELFKQTVKKGRWTKLGDAIRKQMRRFIGVQPERAIAGVSGTAVLPSYIPSRTFALALIDILNNGDATGNNAMKDITKSLADHHWSYQLNRGGEALYSLAIAADGDLVKFQARIEDWYNDGMDRVSGWYKRNVQRVLLYIGLILAVAFNVDTVRVARTLWTDRDVRQAMVNAAGNYVQNHPAAKSDSAAPAKVSADSGAKGKGAPTDASGQPAAAGDASAPKPLKRDDLAEQLQSTVSAFNDVTDSTLLPVGWKHSIPEYWATLKTNRRESLWRCLTLLSGWILTGVAISLGAPFWFDTLNRFMVVRSTIKPQEKSQPEASKDKTSPVS
jgi:hypothetical protein